MVKELISFGLFLIKYDISIAEVYSISAISYLFEWLDWFRKLSYEDCRILFYS